MAMSLNSIRNAVARITIQAETQGVEAAAASVDKLTASEKRLAQQGQVTASVTDIATKRQLSAADAYRRQTLAVVDGARAQDQYARAVRVLDSAMRQGVIKSAAEYEQRLAILKRTYLDNATAATTMGRAAYATGMAMGNAIRLAATFGASLSTAAVISFGRTVFTATANLQEQADQILGAGGNVEAYQALRGIFLENGISMEGGDKILQRLTRTLGEAADGSSKAQEAFKKLALGSNELAGKTADAALPLIAERLLTIKDATSRAAVETALFGKSGQQLESALNALARPMDDIIERARSLGIVISAEEIKKADDAADSLALSWMKVQVALAPIVTQWASAFAGMTSDVGGTTKAIEELIDRAKQFAVALGTAKIGGMIGTPFGPGGRLLGTGIGFAAGYVAMDDYSLLRWISA